ncbi:MAG: pyridoxamine kinase [Ruminococcus sp.]|nr:pyridoxamine kinase [Ruminococcus sp.]
MKKYSRILSVQDISCVGQCSLTVALPILSACGLETCILPSAVLSNHTAFENFTCHDLTDDIPEISETWQKENIQFDAFYTGYLGSIREIAYVQEIFRKHGTADALTFVDPAMADNGKLYPAFDQSYADAMKPLCFGADAVLPNLTEACLLTDTPYRETYDEKYISDMLLKMHDSGAKLIILTGIGYTPDTTGVVISDQNGMQYYQHKKLPKGCHGTGDIYASAFVGAYLHGKTAQESARISADFTLKCIENTLDDPSHWYGVRFETALPELIKQFA